MPFKIGPSTHMALQSIHQGPAGSVLSMQDTAMTVGSFQGGAKSTIVPIKRHAQGKEPCNTGRRSAHQQINSGLITQSRPSVDRIGDVAVKTVL
jgi:hypothetical protein